MIPPPRTPIIQFLLLDNIKNTKIKKENGVFLGKNAYLINLLFTLILIVLIFYFVDIEGVIKELYKVNLVYIIGAIIAYLTLNILMSIRIQKLLEAMKQPVKLIDCVKANFGGMLLSDVTPVRSGYFFTAFSLSSERKIKLDRTMLSIFGPQIFEFMLKVLCSAVLVFIVINNLLPNQNQIITIAFLILLTFGFVFLLALLFSKKLLKKFEFAKKIPGVKKVYYLMELMQNNSKVILQEWKYVFGVLFGAWILKGIEWYLIAKSLNIEINTFNEVLFFLIFHSSITFLHFMPFPTIAGAGASEAVSAGILNLLGIPLQVGLAFAIITRGLMIFVDLIGLIAISRFIKKGNFFDLINEIDQKEKIAENN
ncbi:MAG TPA: lysylphosphatidylglycerol synthase transmembrane domain-containing protein [Candidatus Bilamarchaeaceae archaeon]|nr:lysylphosphatidylglycerol synthase transmembrane domain-containing protein [Candidatus Bilamarchaeaceae archaeon]